LDIVAIHLLGITARKSTEQMHFFLLTDWLSVDAATATVNCWAETC